jgi:hypothetical protein
MQRLKRQTTRDRHLQPRQLRAHPCCSRVCEADSPAGRNGRFAKGQAQSASAAWPGNHGPSRRASRLRRPPLGAMCAYFVPTKFVWRFGGKTVSSEHHSLSSCPQACGPDAIRQAEGCCLH